MLNGVTKVVELDQSWAGDAGTHMTMGPRNKKWGAV
jgi:hypothetical protein